MLPASQAALATANPESNASGAASSTDAAAIDAPPAGDTSPGNANPAIAGTGAKPQEFFLMGRDSGRGRKTLESEC
jgi:hypothetical protein